MSHKKQKKNPPHVVGGGEHGAYDVPTPHVDNESTGYHSGRMVPKATPHRDLDKGAGPNVPDVSSQGDSDSNNE